MPLWPWVPPISPDASSSAPIAVTPLWHGSIANEYVFPTHRKGVWPSSPQLDPPSLASVSRSLQSPWSSSEPHWLQAIPETAVMHCAQPLPSLARNRARWSLPIQDVSTSNHSRLGTHMSSWQWTHVLPRDWRRARRSPEIHGSQHALDHWPCWTHPCQRESVQWGRSNHDWWQSMSSPPWPCIQPMLLPTVTMAWIVWLWDHSFPMIL